MYNGGQLWLGLGKARGSRGLLDAHYSTLSLMPNELCCTRVAQHGKSSGGLLGKPELL